MDDRYHDYTVVDFLQDDEFLQWRLFPSEDNERFWKLYMEQFPDKKKEINEAIKILKSFNINNQSLGDEEKNTIFETLKTSIYKQEQQRSKRIYKIISIAASIALLAALSTLYFQQSVPVASKQLIVVENQKDSMKNTKDVQLILSDDEAMAFDKDADIRYSADGSIAVSSGNQKLASRIVEKEHSGQNKLVVPYGKRSSLLLSDGTKIWINSGSTLKFPTTFDPAKREIYIDGEIYIEVAKKERQPFFVNTSTFRVEVLGTRFNISAYNDDIAHSVVLVEGNVQIESKHDKIQLHPDQIAYITTESLKTEKVNVYEYISWKDGLMQFKSESLSTIVHRLSRYYDIPIECDKNIQEMKCTGKLVLFDDLETVMQTISNTIPVEYSVNKEKVTILMPMKQSR